MARLNDLTGQRFGRLVVIARASDHVTAGGHKSVTWTCLCNCRVTVNVLSGSLVSGKTQSCGCLHREIVTVHGDSKDGRRPRLYGIWADMLSRCNNKNIKDYPRYGGRGISVCAEWAVSYIAFRDWALISGYRDDLTIDRIDNDGNYCPANCRWSTPKEQANNRSTNRKVVGL